jgi:tripartite-type tricarboxylate transporter receptor subunit TctC
MNARAEGGWRIAEGFWSKAILLPATLMLGCALAAASGAQQYPTKPIRIIVAYTPAGTTDILARAVGQKMSEAWSQPVIVDNRPGANGNIGTELAARATPDGYTILMATSATHSINNTLYPDLAWDAVRDFAPVSLVALVPNLLVVNNSLPVKSVKDLVAYAKANPGKLTHGSPGNGSTSHLSMELFKSLTGTRMVHVPYKGSAPVLADLMGGQISLTMDNIPVYLPLAKAGKIRALAVGSRDTDRRRSGHSGTRRRGLVRAGRAGAHAEHDRQSARTGNGAHPQAAGCEQADQRAWRGIGRQHAAGVRDVHPVRDQEVAQGHPGCRRAHRSLKS